MTETGWPLIPREVLPAPVPAAKRRQQPPQRPPGPAAEAGRQLPIFGAETTEPSPGDLAGLLAGPGRLGRMGGTARVSVVVDAAWRVHVLVAELVSRGLVVNWRPVEASETDNSGEPGTTPQETGDDEPTEAQITEVDEPPEPRPRFEVLTAYSRRLNGLAKAWPEAAAELFLSGPRLRLWVAAAGEPLPGGYALGLDPEKDVTEIDAALVRAGLAGRLSDDGRQYLIKGKKRVARLAELVGERPPAAPEDLWPRGAGA
ncbi:hypothetical protein [Actinoplanes sp. NPDC048796]|uniref:hypothetical protein n=1 Tax=Actinoplanes sp. NPDC048796 TaxID=3155640 RepID=UPI003402CBFD